MEEEKYNKSVGEGELVSFTKNKSIILYFLLITLILFGINISDIINEQKAKNDLLEQRIKTASERLFDFATFRSVKTAITKLIYNPTEINKEGVNSYIKYVDTVVQSYILLIIDKDTLKKEFNINNIKDVSLSQAHF